MELLSVSSAQSQILENLSPVTQETVPLAHALGRVLARNVRGIDLPRFDNSSVDGFAVMAADLRRATSHAPRRLRVVADVPAGTYPRIRVGAGKTARIMTGAPIPPGADAVIKIEDVEVDGQSQANAMPEWIRISSAVPAGLNIRRRGADTRRGQGVFATGHKLRPQDLGFLTMLDRFQVRVFRRPRVGILSSGNELIPASHPLRAGGIRDSNSITLASLSDEMGSEVLLLGVAQDSVASIKRLLDRAVRRHVDLIVSSAGVSVGAFDQVRDVIRAHGRMKFWRVDVRPGKPLAVGSFCGIPFLGLPGNPVSAFVGFELFVRPALGRLSGLKDVPRGRLKATLDEGVESDGRESYLRAVITSSGGHYRARLCGHQGSGNLLGLVQANALLVVPAGVKSLPVGYEAEAWWL